MDIFLRNCRDLRFWSILISAPAIPGSGVLDFVKLPDLEGIRGGFLKLGVETCVAVISGVSQRLAAICKSIFFLSTSMLLAGVRLLSALGGGVTLLKIRLLPLLLEENSLK